MQVASPVRCVDCDHFRLKDAKENMAKFRRRAVRTEEKRARIHVGNLPEGVQAMGDRG